MGLDITVYKNLKSCSELEASFWLRTADFPENCTAFPEGFYDADSVDHFRAGPYSYYNRLREAIAALVKTTPDIVWSQPEKYRGSPFFEFINFSDCEGAIDYVVAEKLARDFAEFQEKAQKELSEMDYTKYRNFQDAFFLAAVSKGVVIYD
jgi:hypothetical protein